MELQGKVVSLRKSHYWNRLLRHEDAYGSKTQLQGVTAIVIVTQVDGKAVVHEDAVEDFNRNAYFCELPLCCITQQRLTKKSLASVELGAEGLEGMVSILSEVDRTIHAHEHKSLLTIQCEDLALVVDENGDPIRMKRGQGERVYAPTSAIIVKNVIAPKRQVALTAIPIPTIVPVEVPA